MGFSILPTGKVFKAYQTQSDIAERNKQSKIRSVQTQNDRVTISPRALEEFEKAQAVIKTQERRKDIADILAELARAGGLDSSAESNRVAEARTNPIEN